MSGIYFVQKTDNNDLKKTARLLSAQLSYGDETINHYCISGQTLLGIVSHDKFSKGLMPRYFNGESIWGVLLGTLYDCDYNRELYNKYPRVKSDLELIGKLYLNNKLEGNLPQLNGAFFFILWDEKKEMLIAGNDRYGLYPMYWSEGKNGFCLSSRVLGSVLSDIVQGEWNPDGVMQLLTVDDLLSNVTLVKNVQAFPQASLLVKTKSEMKWNTYWHYDYTKRFKNSDKEELAEELGNRFIKAIQLQASGGKRIGVTLSGGLDSRTIVAASAKSGIPVQTFTWGKHGSYDRKFASDAAELYHFEHHDSDYMYENLIKRYEQGIRATEGHINFFDCHMLAHLEIMQDYADVILNGYAGDLVLGGSYLRSAWMKNISTEQLSNIIFKWRNTSIPESSLDQVLTCYEDITEEQKTSYYYRRMINQKKGMQPSDIVDSFFLENRVRRQCSMGTVLMRYVVESAAPFFEYDMLDFTTSIPASLRNEHKIYFAMIRKYFPESLSVRWQRTLLPAYLPSWTNLPVKAFLKGCRIIEKKAGWPQIASRQSPVDFGEWLRGPMKNWMEDILYQNNPVAREVLRDDFCQNILKDHLNNSDLTNLLGAVLSIRGFASALQKARNKVAVNKTLPEEIENI